jgi:hypothetical protein
MTTIKTLNLSESTSVTTQSGTGLAQVGPTNTTLSTPPANPVAGSNASGGVGAFDRFYAYTGTVAAGTPFTINLNTGTDSYGNTLAMEHVGHIHVAHQGSTGRIIVGAGTHPVMGSDQATIQPAGAALFTNQGVGYAVAASSVSGVEPVEAFVVVDSTGSGTFTLTYMGITTGAITYSSTAATLVASINTAFNTSFGSGNIVASGSTLAGIIFTGTAGNYQYNAFGGHFVSTITGTGFTINGSATSGTTTTTTAGVAVVSAEADTITITADCGVVPFSIIALGRSL